VPVARRRKVSDTAGWDRRLTEALNPRSESIDCADARTIVALIQTEDRAVPSAVASQAAAIALVIDEVAERFRRGGRLIYVGAGTSGRLGVLDASECPPTFGTDPGLVCGVIAGGRDALVSSSEGAEDEPHAGAGAIAVLDVASRDFVLGIATSGTTPFVHGALEEASRRGAGVAFLSCSEPPPSIAALGARLITPLVGPEVIAGSTRLKAGTATKLVLNTISTGAMIRSGRVYQNLMVDLRARSAKLVDRGIRIVAYVCELESEPARSLLLSAGGAVKTALAMHRLGVPRARAERCLDAVDGFLQAAIDRFADGGAPRFDGYPERPGWPDWPALVADLERAPELLAVAHAVGAEVDVRGNRVSANPTGWTPSAHVAHLLAFETGAVQPRVVRILTEEDPVLDPWEPAATPADRDEPFDEVQMRFAAARAKTTEGLLAAADALARTGRLGDETPTLYQFLRGIRHHDMAHALRIRERVHQALLVAGPGEDR